jgi:GNAT superfamily N-acetyltransferase
MEHNLLADFSVAARDNVLHTYLDLAKGLPGNNIYRTDHFQRVEGTWPLSFCGYAADFTSHLDARALARILDRESQGPSGLWVFTMPGDQPEDLESELVARGFGLRQSLSQMGQRSRGEWMNDLFEAQSADDRLMVARFMAEQFFPFSSEEAKLLIARGTALSLATLLFTGSLSSPTGAMMLSRSPMALGLYNLCVRPDHRGEGLGSSLVRASIAIADKYDLPLTLQCHISLCRWYGSQGFRLTGDFKAFYKGFGNKADII